MPCSVTVYVIYIRFIPNPTFSLWKMAVSVLIWITTNHHPWSNLPKVSQMGFPAEFLCIILGKIVFRQSTIFDQPIICTILTISCYK